MKKMMMILAGMMLVTQISMAHEGHDHDAPGMVQAPKGGMIKTIDTSHVEVVNKGKTVQIHLYNKDLKPADLAKYKVVAEVELPRTKKREPISLNKAGQNYEYSYDAKGAHRYTLHLTITEPEISEASKLTFTVEPRKGK